MAGLAQTDDFMLGTATVMIGSQEDLYDLNPEQHSIGLVKNFTLTAEPTFVELTQGVKNTVVHSTLTGNPVRATMEAYEYTAKNLGYALGLANADGLTPETVESTVNGAIVPGSPGEFELDVTSGVGFAADDFIMVLIDDVDNFIVRKIESVSSNTLTVDRALPAIPDGAVVRTVHSLGIGSKDDIPYYAAKIAGKLANGEEVVILIPKLRIIRGFTLGFVTDDYGNMPLEFTLYDQVRSDTFFEDFDGDQARLFKK